MIKLSIIMPVYNVKNYIRKCIESVLEQKFIDYELILVDDGSNDGSGVICDEYSKKDKRIIVIHQKNKGLSGARNSGINIAKGEFIGFIDSDDWIHKNMYYDLVNIAIKEKSDIVQCGYIKTENEEENNILINNYINNYSNIEALYNLYNNNYPITVVCWNKIYKKELFKDIQFPVGKIHEDEFTTHKLLYKAKKVTFIESQYYYYRQRSGSIMSEKFSPKSLDKLEALREKISFMENINTDLYLKAVKQYLNFLRKIYFISQKELPDNKKLAVKLKKESRTFASIYLFKMDEKFSKKISLALFCINPNTQKYVKGKIDRLA